MLKERGKKLLKEMNETKETEGRWKRKESTKCVEGMNQRVNLKSLDKTVEDEDEEEEAATTC